LYNYDMNEQLIAKVRVNRAASIHCAPDWSWDTKNAQWNDYDIWTVLEGKGHLRTADHTYPVSGGDCFLLRPAERYIGWHDPGHPLWVICVHFDFRDDLNRPFYPPSQEIPPLHRRLGNLSFVTALLERVVAAAIEPAGCPEAGNVWLKALLLEIGRADSRQEQTQPLLWIEEICAAIRNRPGQPYPVARLAAELGYSPDHFGRLFKKHTGLTPLDYIIQARIEHAKELLLGSNLSVQRISELLGYCDVFHFSKQFKQKTGVSPLGFRRS
jgi:AraC family transcriptional regulator of arabinose operon